MGVTSQGIKNLITKCLLLEDLNLNIGNATPIPSLNSTSSKDMGHYSERSSNQNSRNRPATNQKPPLDEIDDSCVIAIGDSCKQLKQLTVRNASSISRVGLLVLQQGCSQLHTLDFQDCSQINDACLELVAKIRSLRSFSLVSCGRVTPVGVVNLVLGAHWLRLLTVGCDVMGPQFDCDVATLAEHAYDALSGGDTGCLVLSNMERLVLIGVGGR